MAIVKQAPGSKAAAARAHAIDDELVFLFVASKRSRHTRAAYATALATAARWAREHRARAGALDLRRRDIDAYRTELEAGGYEPATVRLHLTALSSLFRWAIRAGHVKSNPVVGVERPAPTSRDPSALTLAELRTIMLAPADPRLTLLLRLFGVYGMTPAAAVGIDLDDQGRDASGRPTVLVRLPVGDAHRPLAGATLRAFEEVRAERTHGPLLLGDRGGRLARELAWRYVQAHGRALGFTDPRPLTPRLLQTTMLVLAREQLGLPALAVASSTGASVDELDEQRRQQIQDAGPAVDDLVFGAGDEIAARDQRRLRPVAAAHADDVDLEDLERTRERLAALTLDDDVQAQLELGRIASTLPHGVALVAARR